jgi:hypothetical protein|tara:strand:- start:202 stop:435 length:234 start_codon:yes stop_codon:yes gene_type:complete
MKQSEIRETIKRLVAGNLRYCDPKDPTCMDKVENPFHKGFEGYTIQSAEEVLDDIIVDLKLLQDELNITASFNSAQL